MEKLEAGGRTNPTYIGPTHLCLGQAELSFLTLSQLQPLSRIFSPSYLSKPPLSIGSKTVFDICVTSRHLSSWLFCELCDLALGQVTCVLRVASAVHGGRSSVPALPASVHEPKYQRAL